MAVFTSAARRPVSTEPAMPEVRPVRFDGRVALVTGAGRGLGREFALLLARRGASVIVNDIGVSADAGRYMAIGHHAEAQTADAMEADVAGSVATTIVEQGGQAIANHVDVADEGAVSEMMAEISGTFGRLDIVLNNAGIVPFGAIEDTSRSELLQALLVHIAGSFNVAKAAWPLMRAGRYGRVVNVCSVQGVLTGEKGFCAYAAAKGGVAGLTRSLAAEGQSLGILVNGLLPGATTRGNLSVDAGYTRAADYERSPATVAPAACWLAAEECDISGRFFAATAGSVRAVYMSAALGYQSPAPSQFSLEEVRDHWNQIQSHTGAISPENQADYQQFRLAAYRHAVSNDASGFGPSG
jgi:NAD(P)-dependent dehydrogenase (short-subunit alcohol dehydrogenase family)